MTTKAEEWIATNQRIESNPEDEANLERYLELVVSREQKREDIRALLLYKALKGLAPKK